MTVTATTTTTADALLTSVHLIQLHIYGRVYFMIQLLVEFVVFSAKLLEIQTGDEWCDDDILQCLLDANNNEVTKDIVEPSTIRIGFDYGGSLAKTVVFSESEKDEATVDEFCRESGVEIDEKQEVLNMEGRRGRLLFGRVPKDRARHLLNGAARLRAKSVRATGGGAHVLAEEARQMIPEYEIGDEMRSLVTGLDFFARLFPERFYSVVSEQGKHGRVAWNWEEGREATSNTTASPPYPYLFVNIGSGISLLHVSGKDQFERLGGTGVGGATFMGIARSLGVDDFDEALELALNGDYTQTDLLVGDIYGGSYLGLDAQLPAASLGKTTADSDKANVLCSTLNMVISNAASLAGLAARCKGVSRIVVAGSFLRGNSRVRELFARRVDLATNYTVRSVFLEPEGYLGALGCLLEPQ